MNGRLNFVDYSDLIFDSKEEKFFLHNEPFSGFVECYRPDGTRTLFEVQSGAMKGVYRKYDIYGNLQQIGLYNELRHGYWIEYLSKSETFVVWDVDTLIEILVVDKQGHSMSNYNILDKKMYKSSESIYQKLNMKIEKNTFLKAGKDNGRKTLQKAITRMILM